MDSLHFFQKQKSLKKSNDQNKFKILDLCKCFFKFFSCFQNLYQNWLGNYSVMKQFIFVFFPISIILAISLFLIHVYVFEFIFKFDYYSHIKEEFLRPLIEDIEEAHYNISTNEIKSKFEDVGNILFFKLYLDELNSLGQMTVLGAKKGPDSVEYGIKWLQKLEQIIIDPVRCPNTAKEFISYEYERDKEGNFISKYPDKNNHSIDATRYSREQDMNSNTITFGYSSVL